MLPVNRRITTMHYASYFAFTFPAAYAAGLVDVP